MDRPKLDQAIRPDDFASFYWLKEELLCFLREQGLSTAGSKQDLSTRIRRYLETGNRLEPSERKPVKSSRQQDDMPKVFTLESIIKPGWRCSQELRAFFEKEIGASFHFDACMRDLIHAGAGKTLQEAITIWKETRLNPRQEKTIAPQFEYNRHMREFFQQNPGAQMRDAIQAWNDKKSLRRE